MQNRRTTSAGYTLVELAMTILVCSILASIAIVNSRPNFVSQLQSACQLVAADMARGRSLAVTNNDTYRYTFDTTNNQYYLEYSGANATLATLPSSAFYTGQDTATRQYTLLGNLPDTSSTVSIYAVGSNGSSPAPRTQVEFGAYGQTTQVDETAIWLTTGTGAAQIYQWVRVNPITGLATVEAMQATPPSSAIVASGS
jgi:prepilin-type N-terminal cleavage/methylation domain-containing protein